MFRRRAFLLLSALLVGTPACGSNQGNSNGAAGPSGSGGSNVGGQGGSGGQGAAGGAGGGQGGAGGQGGHGGVQPLHVLFVGNSYIYVNDLPTLVAGIDSGGPAITVDSVTAGGATLGDHLGDGVAKQQIQSGNYTHVVIQGQSVEPLYQPATFQATAAQMAILASDSGAATTFFETWARLAGNSVYQQSWSGGSPLAMQQGLRVAYQQAADDNGGVMLPVGDAFETSLGQTPAIVLHQNDGSHPSMAGSYLAAAVMYLVLTQQSDFVDPAAAPIDEPQAATLRATAKAQLSQ